MRKGSLRSIGAINQNHVKASRDICLGRILNPYYFLKYCKGCNWLTLAFYIDTTKQVQSKVLKKTFPMAPFFSKTVSFAKYKNWHASKDFILAILKETYSFQLREFNSQINFFFHYSVLFNNGNNSRYRSQVLARWLYLAP